MIEVPSIFSRERIQRLRDKGQDRKAKVLKRQSKRYKSLTRKQNRTSNKVRTQRLQGAKMGLVQRARDSKIEVRDQKRLEKQSQARQEYLGQIGLLQANQQKQYNILEKNMQRAIDITKQETRRQSSLYSEILAEQEAYRELESRRADREEVLAQYGQSSMAQEVGQQVSLAQGRIGASLQNRRLSARRTLATG